MKNSDVAFRPVYMVNAPDGSVLIADFYERYIAHGQHHQSQIDPTSAAFTGSARKANNATPTRDSTKKQTINSGRFSITRTSGTDRPPFGSLSNRADKLTHVALQKQIGTESGQALHGLWALHQAGGLDAAAVRTARTPEPARPRLGRPAAGRSPGIVRRFF